jgi:hypothetical protein
MNINGRIMNIAISVVNGVDAASAGGPFRFSAAGSRSRVADRSVQELGVEVKTRTLKTAGMRHPVKRPEHSANSTLDFLRV